MIKLENGRVFYDKNDKEYDEEYFFKTMEFYNEATNTEGYYECMVCIYDSKPDDFKPCMECLDGKSNYKLSPIKKERIK